MLLDMAGYLLSMLLGAGSPPGKGILECKCIDCRVCGGNTEIKVLWVVFHVYSHDKIFLTNIVIILYSYFNSVGLP